MDLLPDLEWRKPVPLSAMMAELGNPACKAFLASLGRARVLLPSNGRSVRESARAHSVPPFAQFRGLADAHSVVQTPAHSQLLDSLPYPRLRKSPRCNAQFSTC